MAATPASLGIDLGTTAARAAVVRVDATGAYELVHLPPIPCCVAFPSAGARRVGDVDAAAVPPGNTVEGAKRLLARHGDDPGVASPFWPFQLRSPPANATPTAVRPAVEIPLSTASDAPRYVTALEVTASVLRQVKLSAETALGGVDFGRTPVTVSVPPSFDSDQREATVLAARVAGFGSVRLVSDATAVAAAYHCRAVEGSLAMQRDGEEATFVVNVGAGYTTVSAFTLDTGIVEMLASRGAPIGGEDVTRALCADCAADLTTDLTTTSYRELRSVLEAAKLRLASDAKLDSVPVSVPTGVGSPPLQTTLQRAVLDATTRLVMNPVIDTLVSELVTDFTWPPNTPATLVVAGAPLAGPAAAATLTADVLLSKFRERWKGGTVNLAAPLADPVTAVAAGAALLAIPLSRSTLPATPIKDLLHLDNFPTSIRMEGVKRDDHSTQRHDTHQSTVLDVSVSEAMALAGFDAKSFLRRDGIYNWSKARAKAKSASELLSW